MDVSAVLARPRQLREPTVKEEKEVTGGIGAVEEVGIAVEPIGLLIELLNKFIIKMIIDKWLHQETVVLVCDNLECRRQNCRVPYQHLRYHRG